VQDVMIALGLEWTDLFDGDLPSRSTKVAEWIYQSPDGSPYFVVERWQNGDGSKRFVQRMPGADKPGYPRGFKPCLYRLPQVLTAAAEGKTIYLVEGEKCVSAAAALGVVVTCGPNGCNGWRDYYGEWLKGAQEVVVITDNDEPGHKWAATACASIRGRGVPCRVVGVKPTMIGADIYDHVLAGYGLADLVTLNLNRLRPSGYTMDALLVGDFPEPKFAVEGLIPTGLTLLGGPPKAGKSFMVLDIALGVACGGRALSTLDCRQGSVLYLSLDNDSPRRLRDRARYIMAGRDDDLSLAATRLEVHTDWPVGQAAISACQEWCNDNDDPLLIVLDTLVRAEPDFEGDGRTASYQASVEVLSRWAQFAMTNQVALLAVHHDRKSEAEDWLNRFTGSRGITATASTLLMLDSKRGEREGLLRVAGRDLECDDLEIRKAGALWCVSDPVRRPNLHVV
jgi:hypothetical protein